MIETIIGCASAGGLAFFLERVVFKPKPVPIEKEEEDNSLAIAGLTERKRILERQRVEYEKSWINVGKLKLTKTYTREKRDADRQTNWTGMDRIDTQLIEIAQELGRLK